jgi:predicted ATPase
MGLAHALSHPYSLGFARVWAAIVSQFRRDVSAVHEHAEAAVALSTEQGFPLWAALETSLRRWALAMQGQSEEGMAQVRQGITAVQATGQALVIPYLRTLLADVCDHLGRTEGALQALAEAHALVEQQEERWWEAGVSRLRGVVLLRQTGTLPTEAETCFRQALGVARRQEAHDLLAPIYGWFTEGFDTADLREAKAFLDEWS